MTTSLQVLGWCEWATFPEIANERVNMKIDTGAKTSCLHAFKIEPFIKNDQDWIKVWFHPQQKSLREVVCEFAVFDRRNVKDSGGRTTSRYVIKTPIIIGEHHFDIELTLTARDNMQFRMLLGRRALSGRFLVDSSASYLLGA
ncbi:RimK/LysX family protein [Shewanella sp. 10N.286.52.B9]|uniref:ATP-dependent zinc protease family protein n=1 Tax=Shewanella sp. 10N.286.52.B9 TaxID=1880837 RepID=UPI000C829B24|nr:RimK/LysX family protein [Shewanella sp. 10N.286.52.B9]PMG42180.1 ribosomal protein S6 modification protein [Shewanella sp. 10N.286.52.B9]